MREARPGNSEHGESYVACVRLMQCPQSIPVHIAVTPDTVSATVAHAIVQTVVAQQSIPRITCDQVPLSILPPTRGRLFFVIMRHKRGAQHVLRVSQGQGRTTVEHCSL